MLYEEIELLHKFRNLSWTIRNTPDHFLNEAFARLIRIDTLYQRYITTEKKAYSIDLELMDLLILDAENFYYQAFRLICCLENVPGFGKLRGKFLEITRIRNALIEHSGRQTEPLSATYSMSRDAGIQIKPQTKAQTYYHDQGINNNMLTFKNTLNKEIRRAIAKADQLHKT